MRVGQMVNMKTIYTLNLMAAWNDMYNSYGWTYYIIEYEGSGDADNDGGCDLDDNLPKCL